VTDDLGIAEALRQMVERGEQLKRENEEAMQRIRDLLPPLTSTVVTIGFDAEGLMSTMEIDSAARAELPPGQLGNEINTALIAANGLLASVSPASIGLAVEDDPAGHARLMKDVVSLLESGQTLEPEIVSNDLKTVAVSAVFGSVVRIDCAESWLSSTPDAGISEEIVRVARIAALQTDSRGRFGRSGSGG
jgi:hypothetical protein